MGLKEKIISKLIPVPGVNFAVMAVSWLRNELNERELKLFDYVCKKERDLGSNDVADIGMVSSVVMGLTNIRLEAMELVYTKNVCAWRTPNQCWVFHKNRNYKPRWKTKETEVYRAVGNRQKNGTWMWEITKG